MAIQYYLNVKQQIQKGNKRNKTNIVENHNISDHTTFSSSHLYMSNSAMVAVAICCILVLLAVFIIIIIVVGQTIDEPK